MASMVARCGGLTPYLSAVRQTVPSQTQALIPAISFKSDKIVIPPSGDVLTSQTMASSCAKKAHRVTYGIGVPTQVRFAHTDVQVPDFSEYRRDSVKSNKTLSRLSEESRKTFTYVSLFGMGVGTAYGAKATIAKFVDSMNASADVVALAKIEIKLQDIPEGKNVVFKWRGKPLFVRHRTAEEIEDVKGTNVAELRDPQHDDDRVKKDEWLVLLGVCTHLGCVPISNAGDYGGYYCPCHGSHYDASGRIRKGPAPLNLEIPEHEFLDEEGLLIVG